MKETKQKKLPESLSIQLPQAAQTAPLPGPDTAPELTQTVAQGGCAAKLPAGSLRRFLKNLQLPRPPELHVGTETLDDACLWDLGDGSYLVQTLDFFTPIVDDPADFGAIAAANSLSDVYAMGGEPRIALTILAYPAAKLPLEWLEPLMRGATSVISEAGACLAGGHSITDETLKLGFSVTGFVAKNRAWTNAGARPGDRLILTKALGTGTITTALKNREAPQHAVRAAIASMRQLNRVRDLLPAELDEELHAGTDITGFGLAGHALQLARASHVGLELDLKALPSLPWALESLAEGNLNRAHRTNEEYVRESVEWKVAEGDPRRWLTLDPQTSGGLLLVVSPKATAAVVEKLKERFAETRVIGEAVAAPSNGPQLIFKS